MSRQRILIFGLLAILLGGLEGCGSKSQSPLSVKGRVCYRGEPLPGGRIVFVPDEERGSNGPLIMGTIQGDGCFVLGAEATPGWYRVAVAPSPLASTSLPTAADPYPVPPARYRNPQFSGLKGEVKAGTENLFDFELDDTPFARSSE